MKELTLSHFSIYFDRETIKKPLRFTHSPYCCPPGPLGFHRIFTLASIDQHKAVQHGYIRAPVLQCSSPFSLSHYERIPDQHCRLIVMERLRTTALSYEGVPSEF